MLRMWEGSAMSCFSQPPVHRLGRRRTSPDGAPFKLQGSYRNMNKITEKVAGHERCRAGGPDQRLRGESQTLTTGAESNLLKLAELRGSMTDISAPAGRRSVLISPTEDDGETKRTISRVTAAQRPQSAPRGSATARRARRPPRLSCS